MATFTDSSFKSWSASRSSLNAYFNNFLDAEIATVRKDETKNRIQLYNYKDIPNFLMGNPYILGGYRAHLPTSVCLKSLFMWSNETINIWSHLLGFLMFFILMFYDLFITLPMYNRNIADYLVMCFGLICFQYCMLCSTGYHVFNCHSEKLCHWWLGVDLSGISIGLIGCYVPALYFGYYCITIWRDVYIVAILFFTLSTLLLQHQPEFHSKRWFNVRIFLYTSLAGSGVIPAVHWIILNGGFSSSIVKMFLPKVIILYVICMIALFFYLSKLPEKIYPGVFDYIGSSHQCWHFTILLAFIWSYHSGKEFLVYRMNNSCDL